MAYLETELRDLLEQLYEQYNTPAFIELDPISIPHQFSKKEDIEISAFLTATIAWGQRITILNNAAKLMRMMGNEPYRFTLEATEADIKPFETFVHRTFNGIDAAYFLRALRHSYQHLGGLEAAFSSGLKDKDDDVSGAIAGFRSMFLGLPGSPARTKKHVPDIQKGSSAKRINMFLRWMVRKDNNGVDFGLWKAIKPRQLLCPLDLHTGRVARSLGLLTRQQDDFRAVLELTESLRKFDAKDPVRFDIALFGLGASGLLK